MRHALLSASAADRPRDAADALAPRGATGVEGDAVGPAGDASPGPAPTDDVLLLGRAALGDADAALRLFRLHGARVLRTAARILGPDDGEVDDVVQQTFLAALDGAERFDGRSAVSTWLVGIATRRALDATRARARRARWARVGAWLGVPGIERPAAPDAAHDARSEAARALDVLTPEQRVVFVLSAVEGHTLHEIAAMTGVGVSTLHARLVAARRRLDAHLAAQGST